MGWCVWDVLCCYCVDVCCVVVVCVMMYDWCDVCGCVCGGVKIYCVDEMMWGWCVRMCGIVCCEWMVGCDDGWIGGVCVGWVWGDVKVWMMMMRDVGGDDARDVWWFECVDETREWRKGDVCDDVVCGCGSVCVDGDVGVVDDVENVCGDVMVECKFVGVVRLDGGR